RGAGSIRSRDALGGWLYGTAHRIAANARRRQARHSGPPVDPESMSADAPPDLGWREACAILHEELDRLPDRFRLPLLLCYLEGKSREEAARELGWSGGSVKGRLERGREMLRQRLTARGVTLSAGLLSAAVVPQTLAVPPDLLAAVLRRAAPFSGALVK